MTDDDLRARLRRADPAGSLPPRGPDPTRRLLENAMTIAPERPAVRRRPWLVGAAAAAVVALVAGLAVARSGDTAPGTVAAPPPTVTRVADRYGDGTGKCMPPTAERLAGAGLAFEGTVRSVDSGVVTLLPARFLAGPPTDLVEVAQADGSSESLIGATRFEVGQTYLVAGVDGDVLVCGYTGLATPELRQLYDAAF